MTSNGYTGTTVRGAAERVNMDDRTLLGRRQMSPRRPQPPRCIGWVAVLNLLLAGALLFSSGILVGRVLA